MYNTPPCWPIYICGLVFDHMVRAGGLQAMEQANQEKAQVVYGAIEDSQGFYQNPVDPAVRSLMNVPFTIPSSQDLEAVFIKEAAAQGLVSTGCIAGPVLDLCVVSGMAKLGALCALRDGAWYRLLTWAAAQRLLRAVVTQSLLGCLLPRGCWHWAAVQPSAGL